MPYTKDLPLSARADIVVCGGGTAGAFAAIAAAEQGAKVLLIEQFGSLGGSATNGLVLPIMKTHIEGEPGNSYLTARLYERLSAKGAASGSNGRHFDPVALSFELEQMCMEAGVSLLYHTFVPDVIREGNRIKAVVIANKAGLSRVEGDVFIDATGDGDVSVWAGAAYTKGNPETGKNQPVSLRYLVGGVDIDALGRFAMEHQKGMTPTPRLAEYRAPGYFYAAVTAHDTWGFTDIFDRAIANGDLTEDDKCYWQVFTIPSRPGALAFNTPEFFDDVDGTDPAQLTRVQIRGKQGIARQMAFYKKYLKGFENAYVSAVSSMVGVRESRNIVCDHVLTADELIGRAKFDDAIAQSNYPVDIHGRKLHCSPVLSEDTRPYYEIPYAALVVKGLDNLLVAGRCLGAEFLAQSSLRVQLSVRATGEAAGIGAAMAHKLSVSPRSIRGQDVRAEMMGRGAVFADR